MSSDLLPCPFGLEPDDLRLRVLVLELVGDLAQLELDLLVLPLDLLILAIERVDLLLDGLLLLPLARPLSLTPPNPLHLVLQTRPVDAKLDELLREVVSLRLDLTLDHSFL